MIFVIIVMIRLRQQSRMTEIILMIVIFMTYVIIVCIIIIQENHGTMAKRASLSPMNRKKRIMMTMMIEYKLVLICNDVNIIIIII